MSSLLEQAIIDAKVLKETARKNAEAALLDQYRDIIKENVEALLEQDEAPALAPEASAPPAPAPSSPDLAAGIQAAPSPTQKKLMDRIPPAYLGEDNMQEIEINLDTLLEKVDALEAEVGPIMAGIDMDRPAHEHGNPSRIAPDGIAEGVDEDGETLDEEVYSVDESLLGEANEEVASANKKSQGYGALADAAKLDASAANRENAERNVKGAAGAAGAGESGPAKMASISEELEEEGLELEEELEEELNIDLADSTKLGALKGGLAGMNRIELKRQADVDEALAANDQLQEELGAKEAEIAALEEKLNAMKTRLQETRGKLQKSVDTNGQLAEGLKQIGKRFQDVSLLNARLLYTNKALTNTSLNERQKGVVAEAISKAKSVEAAKTIYETLQRSAGTATTRAIPQSLNEAINRSPSPFLPRVNNTLDPATDRMRILAGIKK